MGVQDVLGQRLDENMLGSKKIENIDKENIQRMAVALETIAKRLEGIEEILISINKNLRIR